MKDKKIKIGIALIVVGILWMLSNLNFINIGFYNIIAYMVRGVFDLWPLILVIVGVNIIFKKDVLNIILWVVFLVILIIYSFFIKENILQKGNILQYPTDKHAKDKVYSVEMKDGIRKGNVSLDIGGASFNIDPIDEKFSELKHDGAFNYKLSKNSETQNLHISNKDKFLKNQGNRGFALGINKNIPWNFDIDMGAVNGKLNLKDVITENLDVDMGAGKFEITLGDKGGLTFIDIDAGASQIILNIPKDTGMKLKYDGALSKTNFDNLGLIKTDRGRFVSENFNVSDTKYELDIDMGVGEFMINYY